MKPADQPSQPDSTPPSRRNNTARRLLFALIVLILIVIALEAFARYRLGLGDPPLFQSDPQIEYLYQPSKTYHRFGNRIAINRWSMRSEDFPREKSDPHELRILMMGDSVINGGAHTDQNDLASEIIRRALAAELNRPIIVGNISAGSWGPENLLAYAERFGFFDADVIIIVLSSHDAEDAPRFEGLDADTPEHKPLLALQEAAQRYLPRYLPQWLGGNSPSLPRSQQQIEADRESSLRALRAFIELAQSTGAEVVIAQHAEQEEIRTQPQPGGALIADVAAEAGVTIVDLQPHFARSIEQGQQPYRDHIHPNRIGQQIIAEALLDRLREMVKGQE